MSWASVSDTNANEVSMIMSAISFTYGPCFLLLKNVKIFQEVPSKEKKFSNGNGSSILRLVELNFFADNIFEFIFPFILQKKRCKGQYFHLNNRCGKGYETRCFLACCKAITRAQHEI